MIAPEVKRILRELLKHKSALVIIAITGIVVASVGISVAVFTKQIGDALQQQDASLLKSSAALLLGLTFIQAVCRFFHLFNMNYTGELVTQGLREQLQKKFMSLNLTFHNTYASGSGGLISRILNDIIVVQNGLRMFADFFREPFVLVGLIIWLFMLNWKLTAIVFIALPMILIFLRYLSKGIKKYSIKGQEDLEKITATIKESLDGVRTIQSFNLENEMGRRFENESKEFLTSRRRIHRLVEMSGPVTEFVVSAIILSIILYISLEIAKGQATFGDFLSYIASLLGLGAPVKKLQESYVRIQETIVASKRIFQLLDEPSEVPQSPLRKTFPTNWSTITYKNVSFRYHDHWILKNINLTAKRGEMIALVGASGSGKSTLVNLLERFFDPTEGEILVDDIPIKEMGLKDLRSNIALVSQDVFLFSDTVGKNIWAGDFSKDRSGIEPAAKSANAHNFIMKQSLGYDYRVGDRGNLLSGGEKQRVSIARAFFKDAPILILDEATSALDSASEIEVQRGLDLLMKGRTAFVIAHRLSSISQAHRILVFKNGSISESGTHQELLKKQGDYYDLHQLQYSHHHQAQT